MLIFNDRAVAVDKYDLCLRACPKRRRNVIHIKTFGGITNDLNGMTGASQRSRLEV